jgi:hypothetical protein
MREDKSLRRILAETREKLSFGVAVVKYKIFYVKAIFLGKSKKKTVLMYPQKPRSFHILYKIFHILGYRITSNPNAKADIVIHFEDTTLKRPDSALAWLGRRQKVLNIDCADISKEHVDKILKEVFGYGAMIDPRVYSGKCVKKSNDNAKHDGKIINCPTEPEKGFVYQMVINNQYEDLVLDLRASILNDEILFTYEKYRPVDKRFGNVNTVVKMVDTDKVFDLGEIRNIILFCKKFGLDYGELDILRNRDDNKLYIVDVNNTPSGPPNHISKIEYKLALTKLAGAFGML